MFKDKQLNFYHRDLSWLRFNFRVLIESKRLTNPILERLKFLSIAASNLDEFFEIRVARLEQEQELENHHQKYFQDTLKKIYRIISMFSKEMYDIWQNNILIDFQKENIFLRDYDSLEEHQQEYVNNIFKIECKPVLTVIRVNSDHTFPLILNKVLCFAMLIKEINDDTEHLLLVSIPRILPRVIKIPNANGVIGDSFILLSDILQGNLQSLFPNEKVLETVVFRVTRNSNLYLNEEETLDLLPAIELELHNRKKGDAVRLEVTDNISNNMYILLKKYFKLEDRQINKVKYPVNFPRMMAFYNLLDRPDLKFKSFIPKEYSEYKNIFSSIQQSDILLHHPYDSFSTINLFFEKASIDPNVVSIKVTLYRVASDSPIIASLITAALHGKEVTVLVELKARFDEASNIAWSKKLLENGVRVVYGFPGLKTHCKITAVSRLENQKVVTYCHIGTGNYNEQTAKAYTDLSLFTCNPEITNDILDVFHLLTSKIKTITFKNILVSPTFMLPHFLEMIKNETKIALTGKKAKIIFKMNSLQDPEIISALHEAALAGVEILGIIRGVCCYKFNQKQFPNLKIISIVGRFLEHARVYYFENNKPYKLFIGSADWMPRNLRRRVEVVIPIIENHIMDRILNQIIAFQNKDNFNAMYYRTLFKFPNYKTEEYFSAQEKFIDIAES